MCERCATVVMPLKPEVGDVRDDDKGGFEMVVVVVVVVVVVESPKF